MEIGREVWDSLLEAYENAKEAINFFMDAVKKIMSFFDKKD